MAIKHLFFHNINITYFRFAKPQQFMQDTLVYIRKIGDTTGSTRKQVGSWALDPEQKSSIPSGYELDPEYLTGDYQATTNISDDVKKRLNAKVAVVAETPKSVEPETDEEVIALINPLEDEGDSELEVDENSEIKGEIENAEPETIEDETKETETQKAEVVKTEVKAKRPYNRKK